VSGDRQRETTHEVCCLAADFFSQLKNIFIPNYRKIIPKYRAKGHEQVFIDSDL